MRHYRHLNKEQRYYMFHEIPMKTSIKTIAEKLGISRSTIYRELKRTSDPDGIHGHDHADNRNKRRRENCRKRTAVTEEWQERIKESLKR